MKLRSDIARRDNDVRVCAPQNITYIFHQQLDFPSLSISPPLRFGSISRLPRYRGCLTLFYDR